MYQANLSASERRKHPLVLRILGLPGSRYRDSANLRPSYGLLSRVAMVFSPELYPDTQFTPTHIGPFRVETFLTLGIFSYTLNLYAYPIRTLKPFTPM